MRRFRRVKSHFLSQVALFESSRTFYGVIRTTQVALCSKRSRIDDRASTYITPLTLIQNSSQRPRGMFVTPIS